MEVNNKALTYGIPAGLGILLFYISVLTIFQSYGFALYEFKRLWYWLIPLAIGFGTQIGLYVSIRHTAALTGTVAGTGGVSAGSMVACCSHFILNLVPIVGLSGIAIFLAAYQKEFLGVGILSNIIGISIMVKHKRKMKVMRRRYLNE